MCTNKKKKRKLKEGKQQRRNNMMALCRYSRTQLQYISHDVNEFSQFSIVF